VNIQSHQLPDGSNLVLTTTVPGQSRECGLIKVIGGGRGCVLKVGGAVAGIWIPLRGRLQLSVGDCDATLVPGEVRVTEVEPRTQAVGRGNALWVALLAGAQTWKQVLREAQGGPGPDPMLLPAHYAASRELKKDAIALARSQANGSLDAAANRMIDRLVSLQSTFADAIARCPGRTYAQRRQVFLRLQRVRNYLASHCNLELDNAALARMANYSSWHFIRAFRAAYAQTPHAYLVNLRLERALELLHSSPLAIAEIALASGFENRCAFSRLFHQRFGVTAWALRRQRTAEADFPAIAQLLQRR
jgi:AraC family transcriptional regulator